VEYRCIYYKNEGIVPYQSRFWVYSQPTGNATLSIGFDAAGVNGEATTISTENDAPTGAIFTAPDSELTALTVSIPAGEYLAVWQRRSIVAGEHPEVNNAFFSIAHSVIEA